MPQPPDKPGEIARLAAQLTRSALGVREQTNHNDGEDVALYEAHTPAGGLQAAWCLKFVQFKLWQAAKQQGRQIPALWPSQSASCGQIMAWAITHELWIPRRRITETFAGDLLIMSFAKFAPQHIGIIIEDGTFHTVEGNTTDGKGDKTEGVFERHRTWSDIGLGGGIIRPNF